LAISTVSYQIGGRTRAFGGQTFDQTVINIGQVHGNAGFGGERIHDRLDQSRFTGGVDIDIGDGRPGDGGTGAGQKDVAQVHGKAPWLNWRL
jgi:hypothetical protein